MLPLGLSSHILTVGSLNKSNEENIPAFFGLIFISCQFELEADLVISNTNIIDLETEISKRDILIRDSVIAMISEANSASAIASKVVDGSDHYIIPGLWDMHVHIQDSTYLSMFLDYGITGVREMGGGVLMRRLMDVNQCVPRY